MNLGIRQGAKKERPVSVSIQGAGFTIGLW